MDITPQILQSKLQVLNRLNAFLNAYYSLSGIPTPIHEILTIDYTVFNVDTLKDLHNNLLKDISDAKITLDVIYYLSGVKFWN